ncbi:MAG: Clostripain family protease, partial [Chloroflexi bacterium]|nr:Clostripain family protease [Chloroflexota bacterium]
MKNYYNLFMQEEPIPAGATPIRGSEPLPGGTAWHLAADGDQERRTVEAGRRRKPDEGPPGGRERAEAPQRRDSAGGGSGSGGRSGRSVPGGKGCMGGGGIVLVIIILAIVFGLQYCGSGNTADVGPALPAVTSPAGTSSGAADTGQISGLSSAAPFATNYPQLASQTPTKSGQTWLVMLYQDADDQVLEKDICLDLNEAEKAGSSQRVKIVAQMDRYNGAYNGDGNWTGTRRFLISQDDNLGKLVSQQVADLGEVNLASGQTLIDFATWAIKTY